MTFVSMQQRFPLDGLTFAEESGLVKVVVRTPCAHATIFLQGAHVTEWIPTGFEPVLFLSQRSQLGPGLAIRGGVPLCFPWFAADSKTDRPGGKPGPHHGFARTELWELMEVSRCGDDVQLVLNLQPTPVSRSLGFDDFALTLTINVGRQLHLEFMVENRADACMNFEDVFHSYFAVRDVTQIKLAGLEEAAFLDAADGGTRKEPTRAAMQLSGPTDRSYLEAPAAVTIVDEAMGRLIHVSKNKADCTLIFNPWKGLADLGSEEWRGFVAVETGNVRASRVVLRPGRQHRMSQTISVEALRD